MSGVKDYYKVMGVQEKATPEEIKKVYRKLAREFHPDQNKDKPGAEERFKEISEAYSILSDENKRKEYDIQRQNPFFSGRGGPGGQPGQRSQHADPFSAGRAGGRFYRSPDGTYVRMESSQEGRGGGYESDGGFSDLFSSFFAGGPQSQQQSQQQQPRQRPPSSLDKQKTVNISFRRMLAGGKIEFTHQGEKIRVPIPKGIEDGFKIRIKGKGKQAANGRRGNLYVTVRVDEAPGIWREGIDLHTEAPIGMFEAVFGSDGNIKMPLGQHIKVKIPAGVQPGEVLRVRGRGIETDAGTGNLFVHIRVEIPRDLSKKQKAVLSEAARKARIK
jgi:DnaJ-class molecular chaperone